ncbi:MAG: 30S ribosome-binding factor RbfA [Sandaracinaceae bacterium]|nr:30S ribosome-binding factor RbfA [Sandaracinaceae bacterium]
MGKRKAFIVSPANEKIASTRVARVSELICRVLATLLARESRDPILSGIVVTEARVSRDFSVAHVYVRHLQPEEISRQEALDALERAKGWLRRGLALQIAKGDRGLRNVPQIVFHWDEAIERIHRIEELFAEIASEHHLSEGPKGAELSARASLEGNL